ncbi:formin-J-like [Copidosoma floridanum]|uniref:formin-J-like n=1 Tax=Copidosoma floridanum TaxID=29053 RepID=UPI000C6FCB56|nr:formin-J-like [Copidosoma floridanum]
MDNTVHENGNDAHDNSTAVVAPTTASNLSTGASVTTVSTAEVTAPLKKEVLTNGLQHKNGHQEYDSATTATTSSPEPEEYTYEGAIRGYVSRVSQNIPRRSLVDLDAKLDGRSAETKGSAAATAAVPIVKVDILKRREVFEKTSLVENKNSLNNNNNRLDFASGKSIKERLSILERQKAESEAMEKLNKSPRHSLDNPSVRERFKLNAESGKEVKTRDLLAEELESVKPLRERLSNLEKLAAGEQSSNPQQHANGELSAKSIKDRLNSLDASRTAKDADGKRPSNCFHDQQTNNRAENSTPSERSSSPDSEYRVPRATFHQSLDSLDADASSGPDTFERVQSLEELDYQQTSRRYPASTSSAEILNDTDREDSGIHTADASCSVSQADEPIEEEGHAVAEKQQQHPIIAEEKTEFRGTIELTTLVESSNDPESVEEKIAGLTLDAQPRNAVLSETGTAEISCSSSTSTSGELPLLLPANSKLESRTNTITPQLTYCPFSSSSRPVVYQSPRVPPRRSPPEVTKPSHLPVLSPTAAVSMVEPAKDDSLSESLSTPDSSSTNTICSLNFSAEPEIKNLQTISSGSLSPASPDSKVSSPLPSPRSPSKIPTPLPRKSLPTSPTSPTSSSPSSPKFPLPPSPSKPRTLPSRTTQMASEIPVPVKVVNSPPTPSSPSSSTPSSSSPASPLKGIPTTTTTTKCLSPDPRRRTVVEVCERVVVAPGRAPIATPFITVERLGPSDNNSDEVKHHQHQPENQPVAAAAAPEAQPEDTKTSVRNEVEEEEVENNGKKKEEKKKVEKRDEDGVVSSQLKQQQLAPKVVMESTLLVQETVAALQIREPMIKAAEQEESLLLFAERKPPPVRPNTLALERTTLCSDFLSPLSPASKQILPLSFSSDEEIVNTGLSFQLGPPTSVEPPKEKPPPIPVDLSDEENHPIEPLKRLNSTRRIKKELRTRRSDFLGIEGFNDDELERELTLSKPPDMAAILAEERRIDQLHRRSYDTDSNYEQDSSHERDSGVELGQAEDWTKQPVSPDMSQHSRQSSEPFGASVTSSEEDEISKKEREIIEVLEREEQWRYENNREINSDIGEKLAHKLRELEEEKMQLERERASQDSGTSEAQQQQQQQPQPRRRHQEATAETLRMNEENLRKQEEIARKQDEARQKELEKQQLLEKEARAQEERRSAEARQQKDQVQKLTRENKSTSPALSCNEEEYASRQDVLRVERELLQLEQEELKRQRNNLAYREQKQQQIQEQWKSLQDVAQPVSQPHVRQQPYGKPLPAAPLNYRASMPNLQLQETSLAQRRRPPPPPIPPAKPLRLVEQRQRIGLPIGNSRVPSADSIPQQVEAPLRPSCSATTLSSGHHGQQMSRQTLQALSAVPRSRIVQSDQWVQRRKSDIPRGAHDFNYQHWLIQEAEQRRISEKNMQRSPARIRTSVPYTASPPRNDSKPLPDSIIQTLTQRVQNRAQDKPLSPRRRLEHSASQEHLHSSQHYQMQPHKLHQSPSNNNNNSNSNNNSINNSSSSSSNSSNSNTETQEKMLSVSGKKKCSHCGDELGRGAAMIIESLRLFYHMECFKCCVCHVRLGDGLMGTDVRVRNHKLHCHNCYSSDDGVKFSCV